MGIRAGRARGGGVILVSMTSLLMPTCNIATVGLSNKYILKYLFVRIITVGIVTLLVLVLDILSKNNCKIINALYKV
jgi:hypothetical protein